MRRKSGLGLGRDVSARESEGLTLWFIELRASSFGRVSKYEYSTRASCTLIYGRWAGGKNDTHFSPPFILVLLQSPLFGDHYPAASVFTGFSALSPHCQLTVQISWAQLPFLILAPTLRVVRSNACLRGYSDMRTGRRVSSVRSIMQSNVP